MIRLIIICLVLSFRDNENFSYVYTGVGGLSWGIPYAVGLLCLGQQVNPNLTAIELKDLLIQTTIKGVVNPIDFISVVKEKNDILGV